MTKEAYYFSHDSNARQDPKILAMISVYGMEGYGRYWVIVETLREQSDYTLELQGKYTFNALAMQMHCTKDAAEEFITDCINEFKLFESDGEKFWSNSLLRRMAIKEEISNKRKMAAEARWNKQKKNNSNADDMQMHSKSNAIKRKESKEKENKPYTDEFELFWQEYPRKKEKKQAYKSFKSRIDKHPLETIIKGAKGYALQVKKEKTEPKFIKHASTFLNNDSFLDYLEQQQEQTPNTPQYLTEEDMPY